MGIRAGKLDIGAIILKVMVMILVSWVFALIAQKWVLADDALHKTNTLADAFKFCGVDYKELDEQCGTQNYIHLINIAKKKAITMYKCDVSENVHYFVANGGKCYFINRRFRGEIKKETRIWVVYLVPLDNEFSPLTGIYREMMLEFIRDTGQCPRTKKPRGKRVNA